MFLRTRRVTLACIATTALAGATAVSAQSLPRSQVAQAFIPAPSIVPGEAARKAPQTLIPAPAIAVAKKAQTPPASVQWVDQQTAQYRNEVHVRVARGDINPDEAERLISWRRWQLQQQAAGRAPAPEIVERQNAVDRARREVVVVPYQGPNYGPYPSPYYSPGYGNYYRPGFAPYAPGFGLCAGGSGRNYSAALCF